jgi:hypothetical protein
VAVPLLTLPTLSRTRETHAAEAAQRADARPAGWYLRAAARPLLSHLEPACVDRRTARRNGGRRAAGVFRHVEAAWCR